MEDTINSFIESIYGSSFINDIIDILTMTPQNFPSAWNVVKMIYNNVIMPVAVGLMIVWLMVAMIDKATQENFNTEQFIKMLVKMVVVVFVLSNGLALLEKIMSFGSAMVTSFQANMPISTLTESVQSIKDYAKMTTDNYSFMKSLLFIIQLVFPWIVNLIIQIVVRFVCYSRIIELMIRTIFAPIAISDMFAEGQNSSGMRYLKKFLAVAIQSGVIFAIAFVFGKVSTELMTGAIDNYGFIDYTIMHLTMSFAATALIVKSLSLAEEVVGVR